MSIIPSGPPKKRGSSGSVYRPATRRGMNHRSLRTPSSRPIVQPTPELSIRLKDLSETPFDVPIDTPKARAYRDLMALEKELDQSILAQRKRLQRLFTLPPNTLKGVLRVHIYNTVARQPGDEEPSWNLRLQGRLLYPDFQKIYHKETLPPGYLRKFSSFFKRMVFTFPNGDKREWHKKQMPRETDGIDLMQRGGREGLIRIQLYLDNQPARLKLSATLAEFLGTSEETQENVLQALWEYISIHNLQDSEEMRFVNNDAQLLKLFGEERTDISTILGKVRAHLSDAEPIEITHQIALTQVWTESEHIYDIEVDVEDPVLFEIASSLKAMNSVIFNENAFTNKIPMLKATKGMDIPMNPIDEEIKKVNQQLEQTYSALETHIHRYQWASAFLQDPATTLADMKTQQAELADVVAQHSYYDKINKENETDYRSAIFYQDEWVQRVFDN